MLARKSNRSFDFKHNKLHLVEMNEDLDGYTF